MDHVACRMMQIDPGSIAMIGKAKESGVGTDDATVIVDPLDT